MPRNVVVPEVVEVEVVLPDPPPTEYVCDNCSETFTEELTTVGALGDLCEVCLDDSTFICEDCQCRTDNDSCHQLNNDQQLCGRCYRNDDCFTCEGCGLVLRGSDYSGDGNCIECHVQEEEEEEDSEGHLQPTNVACIHSHSFKVEKNLEFRGGKKTSFQNQGELCKSDTLFMGVELEVEVKEGNRETVANSVSRLLDNFCMLKEDGSLSFGFEIVSAPATFEFHKNGDTTSPAPWDAFFDARKTTLNGLRSFNTETCGMHIHLSRSALSKCQISKMNVFLNDPKNTAFVAKIAGRSDTRWCRIEKKKLTDVYSISREIEYNQLLTCPDCGSGDSLQSGPTYWVCSKNGCCQCGIIAPKSGDDAPKYKLRHSNKSNHDRYQALNLLNDKTVELRIFKGTLNKASFFRNIEFAHALAMYCGVASIKEADQYTQFCKWVDKQPRKVYPNLAKFLELKNFIPRRDRVINYDKISKPYTESLAKAIKENTTNVSDNQETS